MASVALSFAVLDSGGSSSDLLIASDVVRTVSQGSIAALFLFGGPPL